MYIPEFRNTFDVQDGLAVLFNPAENEGVTDKFISEHPEFSYESCDVAGIDMSAGKITLLPHVHGTDGFYIAKLRKNK